MQNTFLDATSYLYFYFAELLSYCIIVQVETKWTSRTIAFIIELSILLPLNAHRNSALHVYFNICDKDLLLIIHDKTCHYKIVSFFITVYKYQFNTIFILK